MRYVVIALAFALAACSSQPRSNPYADLLGAYEAKLDVLSEAVSAGKMTKTEALAAEKQAYADLNTAIEMRRAARVVRSSGGPTVCNTFGATTVCN